MTSAANRTPDKRSGQGCLGVITARAGSKGIPRKNLVGIGGRSMVESAIEVALACSHISHIVVSTDSEEIRDVALKAGADVPFLRPPHLATDIARQEDAILHAMEWYESHRFRFGAICLLQPTFPLRTSATVARAFATLGDRPDALALLSVVVCEPSPVWCNELPTTGLMRHWVRDSSKWANRQELPTSYRPAGLVAISRWDTFKRERSFLHDKTLAFPVDPVESLDLDSPLDLFVAEHLVAAGLGSIRDIERWSSARVPAAAHTRDQRANPRTPQ